MLITTPEAQKIKRLRKELAAAEQGGFISCMTDVLDSRFPGGIFNTIGVEIIFHDHVTDEQVNKIKNYIELKYKMRVDTTTFIEKGKMPKIVYVKY